MNYRDYMELGVLQINTALKHNAVSITASATLTADAHAGNTLLLAVAGGATVTLPAATGTGHVYRFVVGVTATSDYVIQVANATDEFNGMLVNCDTDTTDAVAIWPAVDGDGYDTITMDGSTGGGLVGDVIEIIDAAAGRFAVTGTIAGTGTVATPFSAAVS